MPQCKLFHAPRSIFLHRLVNAEPEMEGIMGYKRVTLMDIWEIIRRWHRGQSIRHIARALGYDRKTVRKHIRRAECSGLTRDRLLPELLTRIRG